MTPNEKALIEDLFTRLRSNTGGQRDGEAEQLIAGEMQKTPGAAYALAQTVLVQDQALRQAHEQLKAAQQQAAQQPPAQPAPQPAQGGGFLDRLGLGGGQGGNAPAGADQGGGGGGFLRGAFQTAAGVAGGALLFEGVRSLFSGGHGGGFGGPWGGSSFLGGGNEQPVVNETIINDYSGDRDRDRPSDDDGYRDASFDDDSGFDNDDSNTI